MKILSFLRILWEIFRQNWTLPKINRIFLTFFPMLTYKSWLTKTLKKINQRSRNNFFWLTQIHFMGNLLRWTFLTCYAFDLTIKPILFGSSFILEDRNYWDRYANLRKYDWIFLYVGKGNIPLSFSWNTRVKNRLAFFLYSHSKK